MRLMFPGRIHLQTFVDVYKPTAFLILALASGKKDTPILIKKTRLIRCNKNLFFTKKE